MCICRKTRKSLVTLAVILVLKPHTHKLYILRHCTNIVYIYIFHLSTQLGSWMKSEFIFITKLRASVGPGIFKNINKIQCVLPRYPHNERKVLKVMVNNSHNIKKTNSHIFPDHSTYTKHTTSYDVLNPGMLSFYY